MKTKDGQKRLAALPFRARRKLRLLLQGRLKCFPLVLSLIGGKSGLEIGGPTDVFQGWRYPSRLYGFIKPLPIYDRVGALDNCNFSNKTIWGTHDEAYQFSPSREPGKIIIADGSDLSPVPSAKYDFVLSSHNLEHFANPVKALKEWKRVTCPKGALILVLPHYERTFDHRRTPTSVDHMFEDYARDIGEDDSTHIDEVLRLHDLDMDGNLKTHSFEELQSRSLDNLSNRCLHHHVFDEFNSRGLLERVGLEVLAVELSLPYHTFLVARWKD